MGALIRLGLGLSGFLLPWDFVNSSAEIGFLAVLAVLLLLEGGTGLLDEVANARMCPVKKYVCVSFVSIFLTYLGSFS